MWELFDPCILKQENTGTSTELDGDALRDYYVKAAMKHGDIRFCWWHSHHTMGAFWSGTDRNEIKEWKNDSWSLALVINLFQDYKLNVCTWDPVEHSDDVPLEILRSMPVPTKIQEKEYKELCSDGNKAVTGYFNTEKLKEHNRNWTNNFKQVKQVGIWNNTSEIKSWNDSFKQDELAKDKELRWNNKDLLEEYGALHLEVLEEIEEMMEEYASGTKDYKEYSEFVTSINANLKRRNARMKVKKYKKGGLLEKSATLFPVEHIAYNDKKVEDIYQMADSLIDTSSMIGGNRYAY